MKVTYLFRETGANLWRNLILTVAAVVTIAVSLWVFGSQRLVSYGVANATERWEGGIEFVIWMKPRGVPGRGRLGAQPPRRGPRHRGRLLHLCRPAGGLRGVPQLLQGLAGADRDGHPPRPCPPSYRVVPTDPDAAIVEAFGGIFEGLPGVRKVTFASEVIKEVQDQADRIQRILLIAGVILLIVSALLIFVLVIVTIDSRRRARSR